MSIQAIQQVFDEADCLHDESAIQAAFDRMAIAMTERLASKAPLMFTVMNGGLITAGQLLPRLQFPIEMSYLHATRYGDATRGKELVWKVRPTEDMSGRTVVIIDDILDEGHTLAAIIDYCKAQGAREVLTAVLINKLHDRKARPELTGDFVGLDVEDRFLFGCGMDYKGYWRNTLAIYAVKGL